MSIDTAAPAFASAASSSSAPPAPYNKPSHNAQAYIDEIKRERERDPLGDYPTSAYHNDAADPTGAKNAPVTDAQLDVLAAALPNADGSVAWQSSVYQAMHQTARPEETPSFALLGDYTATLGYLAAAGKSHDQSRVAVLGQTAARQASDLGIPENSHQAYVHTALYGLAR